MIKNHTHKPPFPEKGVPHEQSQQEWIAEYKDMVDSPARINIDDMARPEFIPEKIKETLDGRLLGERERILEGDCYLKDGVWEEVLPGSDLLGLRYRDVIYSVIRP
jgi:hypothetical protein